MKLTLSDFRNIRRAEFDLGGITLIAGENEAGAPFDAQTGEVGAPVAAEPAKKEAKA